MAMAEWYALTQFFSIAHSLKIFWILFAVIIFKIIYLLVYVMYQEYDQ